MPVPGWFDGIGKTKEWLPLLFDHSSSKKHSSKLKQLTLLGDIWHLGDLVGHKGIRVDGPYTVERCIVVNWMGLSGECRR